MNVPTYASADGLVPYLLSMPPSSPPNGLNLLIRSMSRTDRGLLEPHAKRVSLASGQVLAAPHDRIDRAYFPEGGVVSLFDVLATGDRVEVGIIGREGVCGWPLLLGCPTSPHEIKVAIGATALEIPSAALQEACDRSQTLQALLLRFVQALITQLGRTIGSHLAGPVERRLARWLLMNHDRLHGDEIELTHRQIGATLGVRRASVTDALHRLEGERVIRSRRGRVVITGRERLRELAGEAYGFAEAEYARLICPFGKCGRAY